MTIGLEFDDKKDVSNYWQQGNPNCCITCKGQDAISMEMVKGAWPGNHFAETKILKVEINIAQNIFKIMDEDENNVVKTNFALAG